MLYQKLVFWLRVKISKSNFRIANISNLKINELSNVVRPNLRSPQQKMKIEKIKRRNSFVSKGKCENQQNCEQYGISNGQTIPKFASFLNYDTFPN